MLAEMHDGVRPEPHIQPPVRGEVVVTGRQIRIVVDRDGVLAEAARRLDDQHDVARLHCRDDDFPVRVAAAVDEQFTRRRAPVFDDGLGELGGQRREPVPIVLGGHPDRVASQLVFGEPVGVLPTTFDQRVYQRIAILGVDSWDVTDDVARVAHRTQQCDRARGRVQSDGVADSSVLRRISGEHQRHPFVGGCDVTKSGVTHRESGDPRAAFRIGHVGDQPLVVDLLERERNRHDAPVELGDGDLGGHVERRHAVVVARPLAARAGQAQTLQDGDVQRRQMCDVPLVIRASSYRLRRYGPAGGKHRRHQRVRRAEQFEQFRLCGAQRRAVHRHGSAACSFDGGAQRLDVVGVAREMLRAVVEHRDDGTLAAVGSGPVQGAPTRRGARRSEAEARHQQGVAEERVEVTEVVHPALREVDVGLQCDARGHRGMAHQVGIGRLFAAEHDGRDTARGDAVDAVLPGAVPAEHPHDRDVGAVEQCVQFALDEPRWVRPAVARPAGTSGDQVRVGRRQQEDGGRRR